MSCRHDPTGEILGTEVCWECYEEWVEQEEQNLPDPEDLLQELEGLAEGFGKLGEFRSDEFLSVAAALAFVRAAIAAGEADGLAIVMSVFIDRIEGRWRN